MIHSLACGFVRSHSERVVRPALETPLGRFLRSAVLHLLASLALRAHIGEGRDNAGVRAANQVSRIPLMPRRSMLHARNHKRVIGITVENADMRLGPWKKLCRAIGRNAVAQGSFYDVPQFHLRIDGRS